jgi:hypothetical protein
MKTAVFQINGSDGFVRLVCVYVPHLAAAVELETCLRQRCGGCAEVTLLGRFDRIQMAMNTDEAETLALEHPGSTRGQGPTLLKGASHLR